MTLAEYADKWITERKVKPRTRLMYESLHKHHIKDSLGGLEITAVTPDAVRTWYAGLGAEHTRRNSHAYGLLHAVLGTAVTDGLIVANPCQIKRAMNVQRKREPVILTVTELADLAGSVPERLKALVLLKAWCGLRWGEVTELRRKDFDNDAEIVFVGRGVTHRGECRIDTTKSGKPRAVVIPPHIRADVKHHLDVFVAKGAEELMFPPARGGCHLNDRVFRDAIATPLKDIKRGDLRIHDLRHFAGTQVARVGNLAESMQRLGHSTVKASLIYQSVVSGRDAEIAAALSKLATGK
jgi:integrase